MSSSRSIPSDRPVRGAVSEPDSDLAEHVRRLVDAAPELSAEQRDRLRLLLCPITGRRMSGPSRGAR